MDTFPGTAQQLQVSPHVTALAEALKPLLGDTAERAAMLQGLEEMVQSLGPVGAAEKAAEIVFDETR